MKTYIGAVLLLGLLLACAVQNSDTNAQVFPKNPELDRSKPVPAKEEIVKAWQNRQDAIKSFCFAWTEQQTHPKGWIPNPRYPQREWSDIPGLLKDRNYTVTKTLAMDGNKMRYSFELNRQEEPDGVRIKSPTGDNNGFGEGKHYSYLSVFDGQAGKITLTSLADSPPPTINQTTMNVDAQNLDNRALMMAFRPLDPVLGHLLIDRAVTNQMRTFHQGKSTFLLEEQRDPSGWKTILRIEPERNFLVSQIIVPFEQKLLTQIDIDYLEDAKWGWIPSSWKVSQMLDDGSLRVVTEARVTSYSINQPIDISEFR